MILNLFREQETEFVEFDKMDDVAYVSANAVGWWAIVRRDGKEVQRTYHEGIFNGAVLKDGALLPLDITVGSME